MDNWPQSCPSPLPARFVGTLKQNALQGTLPGDTDDLNVEHLQLLLLIFHNFSEKGRRSVLTLCIQTILELTANLDSQLRCVPLLLARLLLVFDYLLHQYSKVPMYLFEQVRESFQGTCAGVFYCPSKLHACVFLWGSPFSCSWEQSVRNSRPPLVQWQIMWQFCCICL